jgi:hypothetical protein
VNMRKDYVHRLSAAAGTALLAASVFAGGFTDGGHICTASVKACCDVTLTDQRECPSGVPCGYPVTTSGPCQGCSGSGYLSVLATCSDQR